MSTERPQVPLTTTTTTTPTMYSSAILTQQPQPQPATTSPSTHLHQHQHSKLHPQHYAPPATAAENNPSPSLTTPNNTNIPSHTQSASSPVTKIPIADPNPTQPPSNADDPAGAVAAAAAAVASAAASLTDTAKEADDTDSEPASAAEHTEQQQQTSTPTTDENDPKMTPIAINVNTNGTSTSSPTTTVPATNDASATPTTNIIPTEPQQPQEQPITSQLPTATAPTDSANVAAAAAAAAMQPQAQQMAAAAAAAFGQYPASMVFAPPDASTVMEDQPTYVNPKQYARILKRRESRKKQTGTDVTSYTPRKRSYMHESRHKHAMQRRRGPGGRFLSKEEREQNQANADALAAGQ